MENTPPYASLEAPATVETGRRRAGHGRGNEIRQSYRGPGEAQQVTLPFGKRLRNVARAIDRKHNHEARDVGAESGARTRDRDTAGIAGF